MSERRLEGREAYDATYSRKWTQGTGRIQWKGTDVCIDLLCPCGHQGHHDGDFLYIWRCSQCREAFALDPVVTLIPVSEEHAQAIGNIEEEQVDDDE